MVLLVFKHEAQGQSPDGKRIWLQVQKFSTLAIFTLSHTLTHLKMEAGIYAVGG